MEDAMEPNPELTLGNMQMDGMLEVMTSSNHPMGSSKGN